MKICALCGSTPPRGVASVLKDGVVYELCHGKANDCYEQWTVAGAR